MIKLNDGLELPDRFTKVESDVKCQDCLDTGIFIQTDNADIEYANLCECKREVVIGRYLNTLPRDYRDVHIFEGKLYKGDKQLIPGEILVTENNYLLNLDENLKTGRALTYVGKNRSGKTTRVAAIIRIIIEKRWRNLSLAFYTHSRLMKKLQDDIINGDTETETRVMIADVLVIDDFGKRRPTEFADETTLDIIDYRRTNLLPTFITTNNTAAELKGRYETGVAILGRLNELNEVIILNEKR